MNSPFHLVSCLTSYVVILSAFFDNVNPQNSQNSDRIFGTISQFVIVSKIFAHRYLPQKCLRTVCACPIIEKTLQSGPG